MDTLGLTSRLVAASRECESLRDDRLFDDPLAGALAGDEGRALLKRLSAVPRHGGVPPAAENPYLPIRTRFLDDFITKTLNGNGQLAILAAGMDARAFRLKFPPGTTVYEVERPEVLEYKESVLKARGAQPMVRRVVVECDLREDFPGALRSAGYDETRPSLFLVEGLLPYLPDEEAVLFLLSRVSAFAAPGSFLALDTIGASFLKSPMTKQFLSLMIEEGAPWLFGTDDPEGLLKRAGFSNIQATQPGDYIPARWPFPSLPRIIPGIPRSFLVTAERR